MKKLFLLPILMVLPQLATAEPAPASKVALIRMSQAIQSVGEGKKAQETLKKEWDERQKKLQAEGKKVQDAMEDLRKQAMVMDEKSRRAKEEAIQSQIMKLRESEAKIQADFQHKDQEISEPIIKKIKNIVATISKERGYTLVIDGNDGNVIFALDQDDITAEVIKRYEKK